MSRGELLGIILTVFAVLILPALGLLIRITRKWTRIEDQLGDMTGDIRQLAEDKTNAHQRLYETMKQDREVFDRRVTWLEQNFWQRPRR
jgi:hypothetical protein